MSALAMRFLELGDGSADSGQLVGSGVVLGQRRIRQWSRPAFAAASRLDPGTA